MTIQRREPNAIQRFMRETMGELRKVSWPTRQEAISLTKIVIIVMIITAAILGSLDLLFAEFFGWLLG
ncbi:MAG: preprotein translocase subunit SecE [Anaerolineales bacterium]